MAENSETGLEDIEHRIEIAICLQNLASTYMTYLPSKSIQDFRQ